MISTFPPVSNKQINCRNWLTEICWCFQHNIGSIVNLWLHCIIHDMMIFLIKSGIFFISRVIEKFADDSDK